VLIIEVLTVVLVVALAIVMTVALYGGLLGALGAIRFVRCDRCDHVGMTSTAAPLRACARCRHGRLFHPHFDRRSARLVQSTGPATGISRSPGRSATQPRGSARDPWSL
jgi:hypothetical protein